LREDPRGNSVTICSDYQHASRSGNELTNNTQDKFQLVATWLQQIMYSVIETEEFSEWLVNL